MSHYLNQWWPSSMTHICISRSHWFKFLCCIRKYITCDKSAYHILQLSLITCINISLFGLSNPDLTHLRLDKMSGIWQTTFSYTFSWLKSFDILMKFVLNIHVRVLLTKNSTLVQVMAWCLRAPNHYMQQCCFIIHYTHSNKLQWN